MRAHLTIPCLLALALLSLAPRAARAQSSCSTDTDCAKGWSCQVSGGSGCASPACPPGQACETQPIDCSTVEYKSCQPGPCHADSDCADGMVCYTYTESACPLGVCAAGQECPETCVPKTASACVPRYVLPCATADDCGSGFQCEAQGESCTCSGSAPQGKDGSGGSAPVAPDEPTCTCEPASDLHCHASTVTCLADTDCSAGWTCMAVGSSSDCASSAAPNPVPGAGAPGAAPAPDCGPSPDVKQCVPPYYALLQGARGVSHDAAGSPTWVAAEGSPSGAIAPQADDGSNGDAVSSAGCSVTRGAGNGSAWLFLGALGVFGVLRRRRA